MMTTTYTFLEQFQVNIDILYYILISSIILSSLPLIVLSSRNIGDKLFKGVVGTNAAHSLYKSLTSGGDSSNNDKKDDKKDEPKKTNNSK